MKYFYSVASVAILASFASIAVISGCGKKPVVEPPKQKKIVFFGDSVTRGYGVQPGESFYDRISGVMKSGIYGDVVTINAGVSGNDTIEAIARAATDVNAHEPDIVVIAFGLNDVQNTSLTPMKFRTNLEELIDGMPEHTTILLATSNTFLGSGEGIWTKLNDSLNLYMKEVVQVARARKIRLIDVHSAWIKQIKQDNRHMESLYSDPTHPSATGHRLIYDIYMDSLRHILVQ